MFLKLFCLNLVCLLMFQVTDITARKYRTKQNSLPVCYCVHITNLICFIVFGHLYASSSLTSLPASPQSQSLSFLKILLLFI